MRGVVNQRTFVGLLWSVVTAAITMIGITGDVGEWRVLWDGICDRLGLWWGSNDWRRFGWTIFGLWGVCGYLIHLWSQIDIGNVRLGLVGNDCSL